MTATSRDPAARTQVGPGRAEHWNTVYAGRSAEGVSWYQREPRVSLDLVDALGVGPGAPVIDVGGGASVLVDRLVERGFRDVSVLDISDVGLDLARARVGTGAPVDWVRADVLGWVPARRYQLWHDRAVFHFLVDQADRDAYLATLRTAVPNGAVIVATFASDGPEVCSGLPVARYGPGELADLLEGYEVVEARRDVHVTPWGAAQPFTFVAARAGRPADA
jgi:hypothetical protein